MSVRELTKKKQCSFLSKKDQQRINNTRSCQEKVNKEEIMIGLCQERVKKKNNNARSLQRSIKRKPCSVSVKQRAVMFFANTTDC